MAATLVGLDIGGTKCALSAGEMSDGNMALRFREEFPTAGLSWQRVCEEFSLRLDRQIASGNVAKAFSMGISCGGPLDSAEGLILSPPNLPGWDRVPIVRYFTERYHRPVRLANDANACAYAEWRFGAGRGTKNMVFMTFGTGLGAGLVLDGKLYAGTNDNAGEVGHIRMAPEGPLGYNKEGSAEGFCSGAGMARLATLRAKERMQAFPASASCLRAAKGELTAKELFAYVRAGDAFSTEVFRESAGQLAMLLALTIDMLNPEVIVLGGVYMRNADLFEPLLEPILKREALPLARRVCRIVPAGLSEHIGDYAALALAQ